MSRKIAKSLAIESATDFLALLVSITLLVLIDPYITIPLDFNLAIISFFTIILNIPFIIIRNLIKNIYIYNTIKKRLSARKLNEKIPPFRIKLPFLFVIVLFLIPIISKSLIFYFLVIRSYPPFMIETFDLFAAILIVVLSNSVLLVLKPLLHGKGDEYYGV